MKYKRTVALLAGGLAFLTGLHAYQREFRLFESLEPYDDVPIPPGADSPAEWVFGRLMYPSLPWARFEYRGRRDWREGGTSWTEDYPRADRHFVTALRRLSRVDARAVEQPVNPDDEEDIFNWPWLYAGLPGNWNLTPEQAAKIREYLLRGGFLMAEDFWGPREWEDFEAGMKLIFPEREIVDLKDEEHIFHVVFDLTDRYQIPGQWATRRGAMSRDGGTVPYWRGVLDDESRVMVAICFNSDVGDSWEFADDPYYPEKYSALGIRMGVNYVVYALKH